MPNLPEARRTSAQPQFDIPTKTPPPTAPNPLDDHNSTLDTSHFNETLAQLHHDIDIDEMVRNATPWRKLRSASGHIPANVPKLNYDTSAFQSQRAVLRSFHVDASTASRINDLNKQVTEYRIQIRFFKQFLQSLIDKTRAGSGTLDLAALARAHDDISVLSLPSKLESDYHNLASEYDEVYKLNEDLYATVESLQAQLEDHETLHVYLRKTVEGCDAIVLDILRLLMQELDPSSRTAILRCLEEPKLVEVKLQVARLELSKKLDAFGTSSHNVMETANHVRVIQELLDALESLQRDFDHLRTETSRIEADLKREIAESRQVKDGYKVIHAKLGQLAAAVEACPVSEGELHHLRAENTRLTALNRTVDAKLDEYQRVIDGLQREVNDFREYTRRDSDPSQGEPSMGHREAFSGQNVPFSAPSNSQKALQEEVLVLHRLYSHLQDEHNELAAKLRKLQEDSSETISALTLQLQAKQKENSGFRAEQKVAEKLAHEVDLGIEKQRILKAEKIRLTYQVEALLKDKVSLQETIRGLTDKVTDLTVGEHHNGSNRKWLSSIEDHLNEVLRVDIHEFQRLLKSFNKIADDELLREPKRKLESLASKVSGDSRPEWATGDFSTVHDFHRLIFGYFARAVDIIVNDHVKLLLKESDVAAENSEYVARLQQRIDELTAQNDEMESHNETSSSPQAKLRIEELANRWKAEREARVYEAKEAQRRVAELEAELARR